LKTIHKTVDLPTPNSHYQTLHKPEFQRVQFLPYMLKFIEQLRLTMAFDETVKAVGNSY